MMKPRHPSSAARKPNIGITPDFNEAPADSAQPRYELKVAYAEAVFRAGGLPFVLSYSEDPTAIEAYLDRISGLLMTGGAFDVPPEAYGDTAREGTGLVTKPSRTTFETALVKAALRRNMPVLGICGGMQLLNVVLGGTLFQDLRTECAQAKDHEQKNDRTQPSHPVEVKEGTALGEMLGKGQLMVNSTHHQAVKNLGEKVQSCALAPDGVVEAIESTSYGFAVGVQWHPELLLASVPLHLGLYKGFIHKARENRRV